MRQRFNHPDLNDCSQTMTAGIRWTFCKTNQWLILLAFFILPGINISGLLSGKYSRQQDQQVAEKKSATPKLTSHVILISISGLRSDYLSDKYKDNTAIPTLRQLQATGVKATGIESVYPSLNLPAHATILTGMLPVDHGITTDSAFTEAGAEQSRPPISIDVIRSETILKAARRAGLSTATVGFPLIDKATSIDGDNEESSQTKKRNKARLVRAAEYDQAKAREAVSFIEKQPPNLLLLCFDSLNEVHRQFGPLSQEAFAALAQTDGLISQIIKACERAGIMNETTFLIVAPFGSAKVETEFRPNLLLAEKNLLQTDADGRIVSWQVRAQSFGGTAVIFTRNSDDKIIASQAEALFREYFNKPHSPIWRILTRHEISQLGADPQAAFYLEAAPTYVMSDQASGKEKTSSSQHGANGFLPQRFEMRGALIASGKGIKSKARVDFARLIDLAPTIARLLGIEMRTMRGRVISEMIAH